MRSVMLSTVLSNRVAAAWNCLRGRPTMYRIHLVAGAVQMDKGAVVCESLFEGYSDGV